MRMAFMLMISLFFIGTVDVHADTQRGRISGGKVYSIPSWFKLSFLDTYEDVGDANKNDRHLMIFFYLNACPYCARMLDENFRQGDNMKYMQKNFDVVAMNVRGSEVVKWGDKKTYTEMELSKKLGTFATPTILFLNSSNKIILRLNGYRKPAAFRYALEYVQTKSYNKQSFASFVETSQRKPVYQFRQHPQFKKLASLKNYKKPLAIIFEDKACQDCDEFHEKVLNHPAVVKEMKPFTFVRLDAYSDSPIIDISGKKTTPRQLAEQLGIIYRPGIVLFNEGKEYARIDGRFYHYHFKENLRYVSGKHYKKFKSFFDYWRPRQKTLLEQGVDIDLSE